MNLVEVLKWGAGAPVTGGDEVEFEEAELVTAAQYHRLGNHLLRRASQNRPPWMSQQLLSMLRDLQREAEQRYHDLLRAAVEISQSCVDSERPVFIKGSSAHLLTASSAPSHWSTDLDVLPLSFPNFRKTLATLDFEPFPRPAYRHELGYFVRGPVILDIHHQCDVYRLPPASLLLDASQLGGIVDWPIDRPAEDVLPREVGYQEIRAASRAVDTPFGALTIPGLELAVIIACAHTFRNYISIYSPLVYGTVRLAELVDVNTMLSSPEFRPDVFGRLVEALEAADSVAFTGDLLASYFGQCSHLLRRPFFENRGADGPYGRCLWWDGTTSSFFTLTSCLETPDDLLVRHSTLEQLITLIRPSIVPARRLASPVRHQALSKSTNHLPRVFIQKGQSGHLPIAVGVTWRETKISFAVSWSCSSLTCSEQDRLYLNFGDTCLEFVMEGGTGDIRGFDLIAGGNAPPPPEVLVRAQHLDGQIEFCIEVPWAKIAGVAASDPSVSLLLGVRRKARDQTLPKTSTLLPLRIVRQDG